MNNKSNLKEVNLYYLSSDFSSVILRLCNSLLKKKISLFINLNTLEEALNLDKFLWVKKENSFLPHIMHTEKKTSLDNIVLLNGKCENFKKTNDFDIIIFSPNVSVEKLKNFSKYFLFSNFENKEKNLMDKKKLSNKGFKVKSFIESNMKWDII